MEENSVWKCRTCLKNSTKTFPLNEFVMDANTNSTYGELLRECAGLHNSPDYEYLMPQNICNLCSQELIKAHTFIQQAQYSNNKLVNLLEKKFQNEEFEVDESEVGLLNTVENESGIVSTSIVIEAVEFDEIEEDYIKDEIAEDSTSVSPVDCETSTYSAFETATCPICQKTTNGHDNLTTHMLIQHDIKESNNYTEEQETITEKWDDIKESNNYTEEQETINEKFAKSVKKEKTNEREYKCSHCNYIARNYSAIELHNRSKHGNENDRFNCNFCAYTSLTKFKLLAHIKKSHKDEIKALKADEENKMNQSSNSETLEETEVVLISTDDQKKEELMTEELSDDLFVRNLLNMKKRQYSKTPNQPTRCDECGNIYNNLRALRTHKRNVHVSVEKYKVCPHCGRKFKTAKHLRAHNATVHDPNIIKIRKKRTPQTIDKNYLCSQCSYACYSKTALTHHIHRHHTGEKPYKCEICSDSFVVAYDLKVHRYKHTGEKPFKCSICSKRFRVSVGLVKHKRIHTNEKPYNCKECGKSFAQSYNLTLHKRTHIRARNLKCVVCDTFFENKALLTAHRINEDHYDEVE